MANREKHKRRSGVTYSDKQRSKVYGINRIWSHNRSGSKRG